VTRRIKVDLHAHTTCSDGFTPPRELVRQARERGLDVLAVTDHDTTEGIPECLDEARGTGLRVVPGIEMSSQFEGRDVHVLGFGLDHTSEELGVTLSGIHKQRRRRVDLICGKLGELGCPLDPPEVLAEAKGKSVGRRHVARAMVKKGLVRSLEEAFDRFLGADSPAHVPANELSPAQAAGLILRHGGIPVVAHPGFLEEPGLLERILDSAPIRGVEVYHRYRSGTRHLDFLDLARRRQLLMTGGSDFHGDQNPRNADLGSVLCPPEHWKEFEKHLGLSTLC
jgi:predicted metal-dependent phosphoesterase TrpH